MIVKFDVTDEILRFYDMVVLLHTALHRKAALILHQFPQFCPSQFTPSRLGFFLLSKKQGNHGVKIILRQSCSR